MRDKPARPFYVPLDYNGIDLGITGVCPALVLLVYTNLRRSVWRTSEKGLKGAREAFERGLLVSPVSLKHLAWAVSKSPRRVSSCIATLRELGFIAVEGRDKTNYGWNLYVLGVTGPGLLGQREEIFFREAMVDKAMMEAEALARSRGFSKIKYIPKEERREILMRHLKPQVRSAWDRKRPEPTKETGDVL